jgi:hypothetical protein
MKLLLDIEAIEEAKSSKKRKVSGKGLGVGKGAKGYGRKSVVNSIIFFGSFLVSLLVSLVCHRHCVAEELSAAIGVGGNREKILLQSDKKQMRGSQEVGKDDLCTSQ